MPRACHIHISEANRAAVLAFLQTQIYRNEIKLLMRRIDAYDRFSDRYLIGTRVTSPTASSAARDASKSAAGTPTHKRSRGRVTAT